MLKKKIPNYNKVSIKTWSHFDLKKKNLKSSLSFFNLKKKKLRQKSLK